ncbi:unnamed protein product [Brassica rapa subsp. trilocularis]
MLKILCAIIDDGREREAMEEEEHEVYGGEIPDVGVPLWRLFFRLVQSV